MAMTPKQRNTYIAQQMTQFQGKQKRSVFLKESVRWSAGLFLTLKFLHVVLEGQGEV